MYYGQHARDEHFNAMLEQISELEEALHNIQFEQHWLDAQTDRQALGHHLSSYFSSPPFFFINVIHSSS